MRKVAIFVIAVQLCYLSSVDAAPCYGTRIPAKGKWDAGGQAHIIKDRKLKSPWGEVSSRQYFYQVSWAVLDRLCLDGKIGLGDITDKAPDTAGRTEYPANFAGGYGFRYKLYQNQKQGIKIVSGFQHISVHPGSKQVGGVTNNVILDDWQGSFLVSKDVAPRICPYIGARLARLDLIHRIKGGARKRKKSDVDLGAVLGVNININKSSYINAEAMLIEGTSFNIGLAHEF